jgi:hypothetical protein
VGLTATLVGRYFSGWRERLVNPARTQNVARYRLRFLLQEVDLGPGSTVIGRSASCHITIDDPLVSREHACIRVDGNRITLEDLGSRNGVQVGGKPIQGTVDLYDNDRIRIGSQELVLCVITSSANHSSQRRTTGFMTHCGGCGIAVPAESPVCPVCGSSERIEPDQTLTEGDGERDWSLELAAESVGRALERQSWTDVERLLLRARLHIEQRLAQNARIDPRPLHGVADAALALTAATLDLSWVRWALSLYATLGQLPPPAFAQNLAGFPSTVLENLAPAVRRVVETVRSNGGPHLEERATLDQLKRLSGLG